MTLRPSVAAAYSAGVKDWARGWSFLTQPRRILLRSQRCWWVSTTGSILGVSLAAAARANVDPAAAERKSRRFIGRVPRGRRGLYPGGTKWERRGERRRVSGPMLTPSDRLRDSARLLP